MPGDVRAAPRALGPTARPDAALPDAVALSQLLAVGNPARYAARVTIPAVGDAPPVWIVSASPELYLAVDGATVSSSPIKGTAAPGVAMLDKDVAENVMITDLVRNDLSHVAEPGSVAVPELLAEHPHPGLVHLQSTVSATLAPAFDWTPALWPALLGGTFPPGSVSGAPKSSALDIIAREERAPRGPVLRRDRVDRRGRAARRTRRRNPDLLVDAGRRRHPEVRHGRGHHVGERPRGRMGRNGTQGRALDRTRLRPHHGLMNGQLP